MRTIGGDAAADVAGAVGALRAQVERMQGSRLETPVLPAPRALAELLPGGGLRPGAAYSLGRSTSLLFALLARPSQAGAWCAVVGVPHLGAEAARAAGVDLSRLVLVPDPGDRWLTVTAALADVLSVVAVRPPARAKDAEITRLAARLRERESVLLAQGPWPRVEAVIDVGDPVWSGLGAGFGLLEGRAVTVAATGRRFPASRTCRVLLPDATGGVSGALRDAAPLRAVG
ncbi:MAG: hypothetical protein QM677_03090 [Microbacterium sp.]